MSQALARGLLPLIPSELTPLLGRFELPGGLWPAQRSTGPHRSAIQGRSVEFFEHQDYRPGDDPRRIDWRASAKGDRTMVRFGEREQQNAVYIFLDNHLGMAYGEQEPPERWSWARGVAALMAHSALTQGDPVALIMRPQDAAPASTRKAQIEQICQGLRAMPEASCSQLGPCLRTWSQLDLAPGRVFFISDWLDLSELGEEHEPCTKSLFKLIQELRHRGHLTWGLELLHRDELELRFSTNADALNFIDPTARRSAKIGDPNALREQYLSALSDHRQALAKLAEQSSMRWCPMRSDQPWANALHDTLAAPTKGL